MCNAFQGIKGLVLQLMTKTLVIYEDNARLRESLELLLGTDTGFKIAGAFSDCTLVIDQMETLHPDLVIMDIGMPNEDGYSLIGSVRSLELERGRQIPAVALTGYSGVEERRRLLSAGYQECLSKPVDFDELTTLLANLAAG